MIQVATPFSVKRPTNFSFDFWTTTPETIHFKAGTKFNLANIRKAFIEVLYFHSKGEDKMIPDSNLIKRIEDFWETVWNFRMSAGRNRDLNFLIKSLNMFPDKLKVRPVFDLVFITSLIQGMSPNMDNFVDYIFDRGIKLKAWKKESLKCYAKVRFTQSKPGGLGEQLMFDLNWIHLADPIYADLQRYLDLCYHNFENNTRDQFLRKQGLFLQELYNNHKVGIFCNEAANSIYSEIAAENINKRMISCPYFPSASKDFTNQILGI